MRSWEVSKTYYSLSIWVSKLSVKDEWKDRFSLTAEDYLHGLITLVNELVRLLNPASPVTYQWLYQSRLAVNAVTMGNFDEPLKISVFVKDLFAGFSMASCLIPQLPTC